MHLCDKFVLENEAASHMYQGLNCFGFSFPGRKKPHSGSFPQQNTHAAFSHGDDRKMPGDGTSPCQVLVQNSYIRTITNARPIPSDFNKTKQRESLPAGQAQRPQQLPGCCLLLLVPRGVFPALPIPVLPAQAVPLGARSYLNAMVVFVNDCCHSYQDGISSVHSL